jgi:small subunit ribosomal protein S15
MAKMHSKKHGKSKSRKPLAEEIGEPKEFDNEKIKEIILNYAKQGVEPAMIGERLKKEHDMPYIKHYMGSRLVKILEENKITTPVPYDLLDLMKKAVKLNAHLQANRQDKNNMLRLRRTESKIWRLTKYYIGKGVLPQNWRYDPKQAELLIKKTV